MTSEKIVTLFDTSDHAKAAEQNLLKAGFKPDDISLIESRHLSERYSTDKDHSIWKKLFGSNVRDEDAEIYSEAIDTNGTILSMEVHGEEEQATALAILNRHQTVDISTRYRTGQQQPGAIAGVPPVTEKENMQKAVQPYLTGNETKDEILRLAKEELEVGKRLVKEGTTRIRRYVTEEPVSKTVKLREQHAEILRHAVNRAVDDKEVDWSEKDIVVDEMAEKPIVNKTAHITEEVAIRKASTDHDEKISDTVRQQHIDVERSKTTGETINPDPNKK